MHHLISKGNKQFGVFIKIVLFNVYKYFKTFKRKSNLNIIEKCSEDDEMMMAIMDNRENQNPNQLKKSQSMQAEEIKKLAISKPTSETSKPTTASNDSKPVAKPPTNVDTNKIIKTSSDSVKGMPKFIQFKN
jgi:hypothetical protein